MTEHVDWLRLFSSAVEQIDESVVLTDKAGVILYVNGAFERVTGFSKAEALGKTPRILKSGEYGEEYYKHLWDTILSGDSYHGTIVNRRKDGSLYYEEKTITPVLDAGGAISHFIATGTDVTGAKLAEKQITDSAERLALSVRGSNDGLWDWDLKSGKLHRSARWLSMLGYKAEERTDDAGAWFDLVHPEDVAELQTQIKAHISGATPRLEHEHRIKCDDGHYAWVLTRGEAMRDPDGKPLRLAGLQTDITARKALEVQLTHDALHDPLTGLPNRTLFMDRLSLSCKRAMRSPDRGFSLMFIDLDKFKNINDRFGHSAGDTLLRDVSRRLRECVRTCDTVSRFGGDEFAILLEEVTNETEAVAFAKRILSRMAEPYTLDGKETRVFGSVGIALFHEPCEGPCGLLQDADVAMYRAKKLGAGHYAFKHGVFTL